MLGTPRWQNESVQQWLVGGGIIEGSLLEPDGEPALLLVQNTRRGGLVDWTPPGGVIDLGEPVVDGLTREVQEETGLSVQSWHGPLYVIEADAPGLGWHLRVEVHRAARLSGMLVVGADPDGIVTNADLVPLGDCATRLNDSHPWVREPLIHWLESPWENTRKYEYLVEGTNLRSLAVTSRYTDVS